MTDREALLTGRRHAPVAVRTLHAGPVTCVLDGIELRDVRRDGLELANLLYVAVRDESWNTIPAVVSDLAVEEADGGFRVTFHARHTADDLELGWDGSITGLPDGTIDYTMSGAATRAFRYNRIGFNLLHSVVAVRGRPYRSSGAEDVAPIAGTLPTDIAPQRAVDGRLSGMLAPFRHLEIDLDADRTVVIDVSGDDFETEDQRNFADSTFKTYSTPLQRPMPHALAAGEHITQSVRIASRGAWAARPGTAAVGPVVVRLEGDLAPLPAIGLGTASDGIPMTATEAELLRSVRPAHLWLTIDPGAADTPARARTAAVDARALGTTLVLELLLGSGGDGLDRAVSLLAADPGLAALVRLVLVRAPSDGPIDHGAPDAVVEAARARLATVVPAADVGATMGQLAALIREPRDVAPLGTVAVAMSPTIHRDDDRTVMENLAGLDEQVRTAVIVLDGRPVHVGPVTLASVHGPWPGGSAALGLPVQVDPRQPSLFGAAWTVGALAGLLAGGAATITLFETVGWRGLVERAGGSAAPGRFLSWPGTAFPVWQVLAGVAPHTGGRVRSVAVADTRRVAAFAVSSEVGTTIEVANLTRDPLEVRLSLPGDIGGAGSIRILDADTLETAQTRSDAIEGRSSPVGSGGDTSLALDAYAVAIIRLDPGPTDR